MVKLVDFPIVQFALVIVDAGIFAVNETVDVPTSAEPLKVVTVTVPLPDALFAATYAARLVGTVHDTLVDVVLVVIVPEPEPKTYVSVCVNAEDALDIVKLRALPIVLSLVLVVAVEGGI